MRVILKTDRKKRRIPRCIPRVTRPFFVLSLREPAAVPPLAMTTPFRRLLRLALALSVLTTGGVARSQQAPGIQSGVVTGDPRPETTPPPLPPHPAMPAPPPEPQAIPRFEDPAAAPPPSTAPEEPGAESVRAMPVEDEAGAVEIPKELQGDQPAMLRAEPMATEADVEEKVDEKDSTLKKMDTLGVDATAAPVSASEVRSAQPAPGKPAGQVGSSVLTRTEARTFTFSIPAPRGQVLDRNGYPLAQNKVAHYAAITFPFLGANVSDAEVLRYAGERMVHVNNILGTEWDLSGKAVIDHYRDRRWVPLVFSAVLAESEVEELTRQKMEGLTLQAVYLRHYPQGQTLSHVVGYVGKRPPRTTGPIVNDEDLWGPAIGVDGLEQAFESELKGTPGRVNVLFEADGTKVKEEVLSRPRPGFNVVTSIDLEMQRICEGLLAEKVKRGAMVVIDVRNGDVMALASYPQFDPNLFIPAISQENYAALVNDPAKPLYPRAFRGTYPAASTFKVVSALGFLESGYISANDLFPCPNAWKVGNVVMRNWNKNGEGSMNVVGALTRSCNTWFYEVSTRAGSDSMSYMATRLGLGEKTGIPLREADGFIPNNRYWADKYGYLMSDGEEAVMSIGQGRVEVTPLQVARMMAGIGNGRQVLKPRLVLQVQDINHELERTFAVEVANNLNVDPYSLRAVQRGLYDVVNAGNGTGKQAFHKITVSGKTGTGQWNIAQKQNISWFAGYFPSKHPVYAFAVLYEGDPGEVVSGGKQSAPIVGAFLERYLTEENYNKVRERAEALAAQEGEGTEESSYRDFQPATSIFREGEAPPDGLYPNGMVPPAQEQTAPPQPQQNGGGGLFQRIFKRNRR